MIPEFSPGCFGSALAFRKEDMVCKNCKFASACEPVHLSMQAQLREKFGIMPRKVKVQKVQAQEQVDPAALQLPKKVQDLLSKLDAGNYDVVRKLQSGENPFGAAIPYLSLACHLFLRIEQPLNRDMLTTAFMKKFNWQKSTSSEHARIAIYALMHVGAIHNNDGQLTLRKAD